MMHRRAALLLGPIGTLLFAVACGGAAGSEFGDGNGKNDGKGTTTDVIPGDNTGGIIGGGVDRKSACATGTAAAQRGLSYLAFQFDRSGSMGKTDDPNSKISVCKNVLKGFFSDAKSAGFNASLNLFPNHAGGGGGDILCASTDYATPVPTAEMQALPSNALSAAAAAVTVQQGTPTLVALQGARAYAQTVSAAHAGAKVAIVLVTDGDPTECPDTIKVKDVSDFAASIRAESPTYVIGIGKSLRPPEAQDSAAPQPGTSWIVPVTRKASSSMTKFVPSAPSWLLARAGAAPGAS